MGKNIDYTKKSVTKQITFPSRLMDVASARARGLGYSFPEYVRFVLTKEVENDVFPDYGEVITDRQVIKDVTQALKEYNKGKGVELKNDKEINDYFTALIDEAAK